MKSNLRKRTYSLALAAAVGACSGSPSDNGPAEPMAPKPVVKTAVDYEHALRAASIKLTGNLPTLAEIKQVRDSGDQKGEYEKLIETYMKRPTFATQVRDFFRDTFKMGGQRQINGQNVDMDLAPTYAAMLLVKEQPFNNIVTGASDTCQTLDTGSGEFKATACPNKDAVGVLTDAGVQAQFFSAMAFRRVRFVQETFLCRKFPAESNGTPQKRTGGTYASPWAWESITGKANKKDARIDFLDDKSIICANCHSTMNHIAPLFARFSMTGAPSQNIQVKVPIPMDPTAELVDWLPASEKTAYRNGQPAADLKQLGAAIAADPEFARCMVTRVWNWALSRPDVVDDEATLTPELAQELASQLTSSNWNLRSLTQKVYTSDAFVRF